MQRFVLIGVVFALAAVFGFSALADDAAKEKSPAKPAACSTGGCCGAKATACAAEGCSEGKGCCEKKKCVVVCPVSGKPASESTTLAFQGGKVCFCCPKCKAAFEKEPEKFATKANLQLVLTGQFVQKGCPMSGGKVNPETEIALCGAKVGFCCKGCQGKVAKAEGDSQLDLVFGAKAFKKGFEIKKEEPAKEKEEKASEEVKT
ncbi:MAG: hypothetical protein ABIP48_26470 [Planctomycetota bacterium]